MAAGGSGMPDNKAGAKMKESNEKMCKVSIIIPCYNVDSVLINRCISSIEAQTFSDYEVIVIDDGSAPDYVDVFSVLENKYSNVFVYHQENGGVSAARNFGMEKSQGKYIVFVDADDFLMPTYLEESVKIAEKHYTDIVMGMNVTTYSKDTAEEYQSGNDAVKIFENDKVRDINKWMLGTVLRGGNNAYLGQGPWNRLVTRQLAISTPFNEHLPVGEDIVWNLQLLRKCRKVCIADSIWYVYYMNPGSSSRKYRENAVSESCDSLMEMKKYLDLDDDSQYLSYCMRCWSDLKRIYRCYLSYNPKGHSNQEKELFLNEPWNELGSKRFKSLCGFKYKFMGRLYVSRMLFKYYRIKTVLGKL